MKEKIAFLLAILVTFILASVVLSASSFPSPWPMFRHDQLHTGIAETAGPAKVTLQWNKSAGAVWSSPAIDNGFQLPAGDGFSEPFGVIFIGSDDNKVYALNKSNGALIWKYDGANQFRSSPAILKGANYSINDTAVQTKNLVFIGSRDKKLYALNEADGVKAAIYPAGWLPVGAVNGGEFIASPVIDMGVSFTKIYNQTGGVPQGGFPPYDAVYIGDSVKYFYGIFASRTIKNPAIGVNEPTMLPSWIYTTGGPIYSSAAIDKNVTMIIKSSGPTPEICEEMPPIGDFSCSNSQVRDSSNNVIGYRVNVTIVLFGSDDKNLYALGERSGDLAWNYQSGDKIRSSPSAIKDITFTYTNLTNNQETITSDLIFVGSDDDKVYSVSAKDGLPVWTFATGGNVRSSPAIVTIASKKAVIVGSDDKKVYAFDAAGKGDGTTTKLWEFATQGLVRGSPVVDSGSNNIYITSCDGNVYGIKASDGSLLFKKAYNKTGPVTCGNEDFVSSPSLDTNLYFGSPTGFVGSYQSGGPDLNVPNISFSKSSASAGETVNITITVKNAGDAPADATPLYLYWNNQSNSIKNFTISSLNAGVSGDYSWEYSFSADGNYSVCAFVDPKDKVDESDETNNEKCISFAIGAVAGNQTGNQTTTTAAGATTTTAPSATTTTAAGGCRGIKPVAVNKTQCNASSQLTHVDYTCDEASGTWKPAESTLECAASGGILPSFGSDSSTLIIAGLVVIIVAGVAYYFLKLRPPQKPQAPPQQQPEMQPPEEGPSEYPSEGEGSEEEQQG